MEELKLVIVDSNYCNYLRKYDEKVPYNFKEKDNRPFVGVLFNVKDMMYFAPLSSPKIKHLKMKDQLDFLRIDQGKLGAINFNNMIPVNSNNITLIDIKKITKDKSTKKYLKLLDKQIFWLNRHKNKVYKYSVNLYNKYTENKLPFAIYKRCCNFKLLEKICNEYLK